MKDNNKEKLNKKSEEEYIELNIKTEYIIIAITLILGVLIFYFSFSHFFSVSVPNSYQKNISKNNTVPHVIPSLNISTPFNYSKPTFIVVISSKQKINLSIFEDIRDKFSKLLNINLDFKKVFVEDLDPKLVKSLRIIPAMLIYLPSNYPRTEKLESFLKDLIKLNPSTYLVLPYHPIYGYATIPMFYKRFNISYYYTISPNITIVEGDLDLVKITKHVKLIRLIDLLSDVLALNVTINNVRIINYSSFKFKNVSYIYPIILIKVNVSQVYPTANRISKDIFVLTPLNFKPLTYLFNIYIFEVHKAPKITKYNLILGDVNKSKLIMFEFMDLHCPFCAKYQNETFPEIFKNYINTSKVAYVYKNFIVHPDVIDLHKYWVCTYLVSKDKSLYLKILETLYNKFWTSILNHEQYEPSIDDVKSLVAKNINWIKIEECVKTNKNVSSFISEESNEANDFAISGTPGFVIWNKEKKIGVAFAGALSYENFKNIIDSLLNQ